MKSIKSIIVTCFLAIAAFAAASSYSSCRTDICERINCRNGGVCKDGGCECPFGYEGMACERMTRDKFVGSWNGTTQCTGIPAPSTNVIVAAGSTHTDVNITIIGVTVKGALTSGTTVTIPQQQVSYYGIFAALVSGTLTLAADSTMTSSISVLEMSSGFSQDCTGTLTKN